MNEIQFLHKNMQRWEEFESLLIAEHTTDPDHLFELYIILNEDLAYARTYFPDSEALAYLNALTQKIHAIIYKNKPAQGNKIVYFWKYEFPLLVYRQRKDVLISFLILFLSALIGVISFQNDVRFARIIMGDSYVNMTEANIANKDPLAVYKSMNQMEMFLGISLNNIKVSFMAFVFGVFTPLGTAFLLLQNGVMLGAFHMLFAHENLLTEAFATIWIHGTLEIFAIIVAGAAGLIMGKSILFPGTYTRAVSFRRGAEIGAKMVLGLVPVFIIAAFLEGFVTRHTHLSLSVRFFFVAASVASIVYYFYSYPSKLTNKKNHGTNQH